MHLKFCLPSKLKFNVLQLFYSQADMLVCSLKIIKTPSKGRHGNLAIVFNPMLNMLL